jgi:probable HAF family extracellular repeat protein
MKVWDLGTLPGGLGAWVGRINDFGVAVGWASLSGWDQQHPAMIPLFGPNAMQWVDLGTLGGEGYPAQAMGISNTGIIVGHSTTSAGDDHAFVWTFQTGIADLGTLPIPGHTQGMAIAVNRNGSLIVGWSEMSGRVDARPVVWTPSMEWTQHGLVMTWKIHELDATALGQYTNGHAIGVNNRGQIVGNVWGEAGYIGVLWAPVGDGKKWEPVQLSSAEYPIVMFNHINDHGEFVGTACHADWIGCGAALGQPVRGAKKAYKVTQLAAPSGGYGAWADCINNRGDISGVAVDENGSYYGAQWSTKDSAFIRLMPTLTGQTWSFLAGVNESGIAVGGYGTVDFQHGVAAQFH